MTERLQSLVDDLRQAHPNEFSKTAPASIREIEPDIWVVACGKPGDTRNEYLRENFEGIVFRIGDHIPANTFVVVVTNPVDIIVEALRIQYVLPSSRIVGVGGDSDARRFRWALGGLDADVLTLGVRGEAAAILIDGVPLEHEQL